MMWFAFHFCANGLKKAMNPSLLLQAISKRVGQTMLCSLGKATGLEGSTQNSYQLCTAEKNVPCVIFCRWGMDWVIEILLKKRLVT